MRIDMGQFLLDVALEATTYPNISKTEISGFESAVWDILNDPNSTQDRCTNEDDLWYIHLGAGESTTLTAENLSLAIQDGKSIEDFAAAVIQGRED